MKARQLSLAPLALVISLIGCGQDLSVAPDLNRDADLNIEATEVVRNGRTIFQECESNALATLSLGELVLLTPYLTGTKTADNSTLSEMIQITPIVLKFQAAFKAEVSQLSLGDVVKLTGYMKRTGKNRFPYPEIVDGSNPAA